MKTNISDSFNIKIEYNGSLTKIDKFNTKNLTGNLYKRLYSVYYHIYEPCYTHFDKAEITIAISINLGKESLSFIELFYVNDYINDIDDLHKLIFKNKSKNKVLNKIKEFLYYEIIL